MDVTTAETTDAFRLPVQWVLQGETGGLERGYAGVVNGGRVAPGDAVVVLPSGQRSRVRDVRTYDGPLAEAHPEQSVALYLEDHVDVSRGDMLCHAERPPGTARSFEATLAWMGGQPLELGRSYALRHTTRWLRARVTGISSEVDVHSLEACPGAGTLTTNAIGHVLLETSAPLAHDSYDHNRVTGAFILVDEASHETVAAGMLRRALEPADVASHDDAEAARAPALPLGVCLVVPAQDQGESQIRQACEAIERSGLYLSGLLLCRDSTADSAADVAALARLRDLPGLPPVVGELRDGAVESFDGSLVTKALRRTR